MRRREVIVLKVSRSPTSSLDAGKPTCYARIATHDQCWLGRESLSCDKNCDGRRSARSGGDPFNRIAATNFYFTGRPSFAEDPSLGKPSHRGLSQCDRTFPRLALCIQHGPQNARFLVWDVWVCDPQQHEFSPNHAVRRPISSARDTSRQASLL